VRACRAESVNTVGLFSKSDGSKSPGSIRHKGKKLSAILEAHQKFLSGHADAERADLAGADLSYANLKGVRLGYANLQGAKLSHANLRDSSLDVCGSFRG
jgi:uncharacterized protein YjbI with pentapeptide repeats